MKLTQNLNINGTFSTPSPHLCNLTLAIDGLHHTMIVGENLETADLILALTPGEPHNSLSIRISSICFITQIFSTGSLHY